MAPKRPKMAPALAKLVTAVSKKQQDLQNGFRDKAIIAKATATSTATGPAIAAVAAIALQLPSNGGAPQNYKAL